MAPVIYVSVQVSNSLRALLLVWGVAAKGPSYASMHTHISIYIYIYDCMCVSMCVCVCVHLWECQRVLLADFWRILCSCFVSFAFEPLARTSCEPNEERRTDIYTQADLYSVCVFIYIYVGAVGHVGCRNWLHCCNVCLEQLQPKKKSCLRNTREAAGEEAEAEEKNN